MNKKHFYEIFKIIIIGFFLIILEFTMYTIFDFFLKNQIIVMFVSFYIARIAYQDREQENLLRNQILGVILGIAYALFTNVSPELYALFSYIIVTFMTKYAHSEDAYVLFSSINLMYFGFFLTRILYFIFKNDVVFDFYNIIIINLLLLTIINGIICFVVAKRKNKKKEVFKGTVSKYV